MESPDSDPIVAEIPVYLSKSLEGLLHVFSFPLRSSSRPYETANVELDVSEVNPSSTSASDNANDPRLAGLVDPAAAAAADKAKNNNQRTQNVFGSSFEAGSNAALPSSSRHPNADQVVVGVRPKFTLHMSFDTSGPTADSFSGRDPVVDARNNNKKYVATGHVSTLADDQPFGDLLQQSQPLADDAASSSQFGGGSNTNNQSGGGTNNNSNAYYYRLESTPAPQHASYACALFYRNALHLTPITGLHQFFPKPLIDKNLELTLDSQQQQGGGAGQQQGGAGGQQQMSVAPTYQPRVLPRSIAIAKATERTRRIDFLSSDHCDTVPVAQRLIASSALQYQHSSAGDRAGSTSSTSSVSDKNKNNTKTMPPLPANAVEASRTAGAMARSSSDPLRDEEEMMWGLQAFFPFIDSAPEHEQLNLGRAGVGARQGGLQFLQQALASGKSNIALKFAHHAMGIDEQVSAVVTGGKLATCEDLQRHVSTPSSSSGGGGGGSHHHHRSNSKERAGSTSSNSSSGSSSSISANSVPVVRLVQALRRVSVCVHGVWASLWDPSCSGIGAFVREFLLYCFAVESDKNDASISAREIFDLCGLNQQEQQHENISTSQLRKTIRSILPILADLDQKTKRWSLKNYCGGKHALALLNNSSEEVRKEVTDQYNGWVKRKELVLSNMRLLAQGEQVPRVNLALRAVAAAGMAALKGQQLSGGSNNNNTSSSSSSLQQQRQEMIQNEELSRCRRFIRNSFELHGVINKGLFRERILSMQKEKQSIIFAVQKESLQNALREELRGFTDSTWILKNPVDPLTAPLRPYFIEAIVKKKTFTTREIEQLAFQLIVDDPQQTVLKDPQSSVVASQQQQQQQQKQTSSATDDNSSATNDNNSDAAATSTTSTKKHINISSEHHQMAVRLINELATFHRAEKIWHIKNGIVTFLSIQ